MRIVLRVLLALWPAGALAAQELSVRPTWERETGYVALQQAARDAATDQLVLIVASHPDDRHVMPAAYLRFEKGWRTAILLMTRGEGGQNSKGPEIGDELGWRRTLEMEACAADLDARVYYLNRQDAGYTRSAEEALELWGRDDTIATMARLLRQIRPDVVLTTHGPDERHGHDLALLHALPAALRMAADPEAELGGLAPFEVPKAFRGPSEAERPAVRCELPMRNFDAARGRTLRQLAYLALKKHESQEPIRPMVDLFDDVVPLYPVLPPGTDNAAWLLEEGLPSLFPESESSAAMRALKNGLDELVGRVGAPGELDDAIHLYESLHSLDLAPGSDADLRRQRRLEALQRVILHSSGFRVHAEVARGVVAVTGHDFPVDLHVQVGRDARFRDLRIEPIGGGQLQLDCDRTQLEELPAFGQLTVAARYGLPAGPDDHRNWLKRVFTGDTYAPPVQVRCRVGVGPIGGPRRFDLAFDVVVPVDVRPAVELEAMPRAILLHRGKNRATLRIGVTRHTDEPLNARLEVLAPAVFALPDSPVEVRMTTAEYHDYQFHLNVPDGLQPGVYNLHVRLGDHRTLVPVHKVDVEVPDDVSVGLIRGVDDTAETVLRAYLDNGRFERLDAERLAMRSLSDFDTIVIDIRALREQPQSTTWRAARMAFPRLLSYVREGGRLVVFYHKDTEFNPGSAGFLGSPYPLSISRNRVTREDAPVEIVADRHRLLTVPNEIKPEDWDGWVQERGLYFPEGYARTNYEEIIAMADPGQPKLRGALLYARHGRGVYVYCALALYRQLDFYHPGACRIFANLVFDDPSSASTENR